MLLLYLPWKRLQSFERVEQRSAMAEHVEASLAVSHVLVGVGAEVDRGIEASLAQHFDEDRNDVAVDVFEALDGGVDGLAVLLPQPVAVHGEAGFGHKRGALFRVVLARLVLLPQAP